MQKVNYVRLYTDEKGESHFEDLELELPPVDFAPPAGPLNILPFFPVEKSILMGVPVGWAGEAFHPVPIRSIMCLLQGEYQITASDGTSRNFPAGSMFLAEDTWGKGHTTSLKSETEGLILVVTLSDSEETPSEGR